MDDLYRLSIWRDVGVGLNPAGKNSDVRRPHLLILLLHGKKRPLPPFGRPPLCAVTRWQDCHLEQQRCPKG
ncbi:MAG TPA: hypothetical protein VFE77_09025 [Rhodanobacter sp.]|nr:hypothetical protein [Rhodanobacter sp.]